MYTIRYFRTNELPRAYWRPHNRLGLRRLATLGAQTLYIDGQGIKIITRQFFLCLLQLEGALGE